MRFLVATLLCLTLVLAGCTTTPGNGPPTEVAGLTPLPGPTPPPEAESEVIAELGSTTRAVPVPGTDGFYILQREGQVLFFRRDGGAPQTVLDVSDRVDASPDLERGLKGIALHPDFEDNGMVFVVYDGGDGSEDRRRGYGHLTRFFADPDAPSAGWTEGDVVLDVSFNNPYHNMAGVGFGPDGMLYLGIGDGSWGPEAAQDRSTLYGSILRIDVDAEEGYEIPADNPFVDEEGSRGEIWLYGLRNPWRFAFHPENGDLFIASVGESSVESVYWYPGDGSAPRNQGWPYFEGDQPYGDYGEPPEPVNMPIVAYSTVDTGRCAVIGGAIYQGDDFPALRGKFVFADHCSGFLMFTEQVDGEWTHVEWFRVGREIVNSVDIDHDGELVVSGLRGQLLAVSAT